MKIINTDLVIENFEILKIDTKTVNWFPIHENWYENQKKNDLAIVQQMKEIVLETKTLFRNYENWQLISKS